jgi:hypothetical protein
VNGANGVGAAGSGTSATSAAAKAATATAAAAGAGEGGVTSGGKGRRGSSALGVSGASSGVAASEGGTPLPDPKKAVQQAVGALGNMDADRVGHAWCWAGGGAARAGPLCSLHSLCSLLAAWFEAWSFAAVTAVCSN